MQHPSSSLLALFETCYEDLMAASRVSLSDTLRRDVWVAIAAGVSPGATSHTIEVLIEDELRRRGELLAG